MDFAVYAMGVFLFTECYYSVADASKEVNIGAFWCVLTVVFGLYPSDFVLKLQQHFNSVGIAEATNALVTFVSLEYIYIKI